MRMPPLYSVLGLLAMLGSEIGMLLGIEPFWSWHTPIAWTGYILFVDGLVWMWRGDSWLTSARAEFAFLVVVSIPLWLIFEFYNLLIQNWHYINLPEHPVARYAGYAWSFATIWPAIFETGDLMAALRGRSRPARGVGRPGRFTPWDWAAVVTGVALLTWPLVWPSPYLAAPVWLGFIFLLDPLNARAGGESLSSDVRSSTYDRVTNLCLAGVVCGLLWEVWNYWAHAKWIYTVPILPNLKLFEMPLPGYLGFPVFALECFTMYVALRWLLWRGSCRSISL